MMWVSFRILTDSKVFQLEEEGLKKSPILKFLKSVDEAAEMLVEELKINLP